MAFWDFIFGSPEKHKRVSTLRPEQEGLYQQLEAAGLGMGAGGAFGQSADYYRDLLSDDSQTMQQLSAPEMRRFQQDIIPQLSEQFAGMGSGALSSSGFRNAAVGAGTDLAERLGALRAQLRQQGAQGLTNIGQLGLGNYSQDVMTQPGTQGLVGSIGPAAVNAGIGFLTGGPGGALAGGLGSLFSGAFGQKRGSSPYGDAQDSILNSSQSIRR